MVKLIAGTGSGAGQHIVDSNGDVVFRAQLIRGVTLENSFDHDEVIDGFSFNVEEGFSYELIVNASFAGKSEAKLQCSVEGEAKIIVKDIVLTGDAEFPGIDYEVGRFHIYP